MTLTPRWRRRALRAALAAAAGLLALLAWRARFVAPEPTLLLRDRQGRFLGEVAGEGEEFGYWPVAGPPPRVVAATLALEDRRFWRHPGVDPWAAARAFLQNLRGGRRVSGASTLAMQVARMEHPGARTYLRKAAEALTALAMTALHGRRAVLAHYLRIVPYGNRIHGIAYAARRYLDKPVEDLSWAETAFLAAIPQAPGRANPFVPSGRERAVERGGRILDRLYAQGLMSREEHELARTQIARLVVPPAGERPREAMHAVLRLSGELRDPARRRSLAARPIVKTSLDLDVQREVAWIALRSVRALEAKGAGNASVVVLDRESNEVRAWVGSTDYFDPRHAGAIDYGDVERSPGSALKPFVYALALERGVITPATILDDLGRGAGGIVNADESFLGPLLPRVALANSRNVPATDLVARLGVDGVYGFLRDLGLHDGHEPAHRFGLGLAIGGLPVTLESLVRAYSALARDGRLSDPVWYEGQERGRERRVLSEDTARQIALFLSDPMARLPGFSRMGTEEYPFPVAVKTGTSSRFRDAWTVAFSTRWVVGVWIGDPGFRPMNHLTGSRAAAALAQKVLLDLQRDQGQGLGDLAFPPPRGFRSVRLCALTGRRATRACDRVLLEWFRPGEEPQEACTAHLRVAIDSRSGLPASARTPAAFVEARTLLDLPPRYAAWAAAAGLPRLGDPGLPRWPRAPRAVRVSVVEPETGLRILRDPETPPEEATLGLRAVVDPPAAQVVWYVDGAPFRLVDYPYATRWPLVPGDHVFQARLAQGGAASAAVRVCVD